MSNGADLASRGTGWKTYTGELVEALLPVLAGAAADLGVDLALVLTDDRDAAAVEARRDPAGSRTALPDGD